MLIRSEIASRFGRITKGFVGASQEAISEASKTVHAMGWLEVPTLRARIAKIRVGAPEAALRIASKLEG